MAKLKSNKKDQAKISACYMVKNAAKDLRRSLKSLAEYVDEIIVVDTGSTDNTVEIAESYGAKIFHEPWQDDFAAPRNVAISAATGDWIVFLDADEFFVNGTGANLQAAIKRAQSHKLQGIFVSLINVDADKDYKVIEENHAIRILENVKGLHYVGKIHETPFIGDEILTNIAAMPEDMLTLWHTGYSSSIVKSKFERNLKLLLEELETSDKPERTYGYLADCYYGLGDLASAEKYARLHVETIVSSHSTRCMRMLIELISRNPNRADELKDLYKMAVEQYPKMPEFSARLAIQFAKEGKYNEAINAMRQALDKFKHYGKQVEKTEFTEENAKQGRELIEMWEPKIEIPIEERREKVRKLTIELTRMVHARADRNEILKIADKIFMLKSDEDFPYEKITSTYVDFGNIVKADMALSHLEENFPPNSYRLMLRSRIFSLTKNMMASIEYAHKALELNNNAITTMMLIHNQLGQSYRAIGETDKSVEQYKINALSDINHLKGTAFFEGAEKTRRDDYGNVLFNMHNQFVSREEIFEMSKGFNKLLENIPRYGHKIKKHSQHEKIRIGYISPDVRFHVVTFFSTHFFGDYDRTRFKVYIYANNKEDHITKQLKEVVDGYRNVLDKKPSDIAEQIVKDEIDILVDLAGHTANNLLEVLAYKPAPIQISGIGYFDTTGLDVVDYFLVDKYTDPKGLNDQYFTEKLLRLQHSHFCYVWHDLQHPVTPAPCTKNGYVTFVSFNDFGKVNDKVLGAWSKIMAAVPNSRLYLKGRNFLENCGLDIALERMKAVGIDLDRVDYEYIEKEYLRCYARADIALDTFPYPGGGTTCDALYMGVPVITLIGERHNSRFGYSLLMNMGLEELCAKDIDDYVTKAIDLANDYDRIRDYHLTIRRKMEESPVMNDIIYMGEIELAYEKIFNAWINNKPLPDFPQNPPPINKSLAKEYYRRAMNYVGLEDENGKSKYNQVDFKRTVYYGELAAQVESVVDSKLLLAIADRKFILGDNVGSYETMKRAIDYIENDTDGDYSNQFLSEAYAKLAKYAQNNGYHVEAVQSYERAFDYAETNRRKLEMYDALLLGLHFIDISSEDLAAPHLDYQHFFDGIEQFTTYKKNHDRIRVGYISGDFRKHATFSIVFGFISCHDRSKFEITCYSRTKDEDEFTNFFKRGVEHFVDVRNLDDRQLAQKIHDDEIDIAFDLAGHTGYNGLPALAYKPAPIQISGIGYMSTTGLKAIDYLVTDKIVDPPGENEKYFTEKFLYMPAQFCYARREDLEPSKGAAAVENGYVTFGTICRYSKINDEMLQIWTEILNRVPTAKLLMRAQEFISNNTVDILYEKMKSFGCDMDRVVFRPAVQDYFRVISQVDIILDSYPYVGGATTLDALYMGVPVVNFYGERHSTRFSKSVLTSIGLEDLSVNTVEDYINCAVALANDIETLDLLHKNLRNMFLGSDALDPMKYCRLLESKFVELVNQKNSEGK
ncbi:MAG: glycosyltransferase [Selenomonadaceae bacterium]|nr:glycosyltransferase [Selenomonadaceae bacterium]